MSGRIGCQVDRSEEHFGLGTLFADYAAIPGSDQTPADPLLLPEEFRDQSTETSLLLELARAGDGYAPRVRGSLLSGRRRTRGSLNVAGNAGRSFLYSNELTFQGGPAAGGGWFNELLTLEGRRRLPGKLEARLRAPVERSVSSRDSSPRLFDHTAFRPSLGLRRSLGWQGEVGLRGGYNAWHVTGEPSRSYGEPWGEAEWTRFFAGMHSVRLLVRSEDRRFVREDSLLPSYREDSAEGEMTWRAARFLRARLTAEGRQVRLHAASPFLRDHRILNAALRLETGLKGLGRAKSPPDDSLLLEDPEGAELRATIGGRLGVMRNRRADASDYQTAGGLVGLSLEAFEPLWFDISLETGRRTYRSATGLPPILYQDLDLSLSRTAYSYFTGSWLMEVRLPTRLNLEGSAFYERERHSDSLDDVTLWSFTLSLTRSF